MPSLLWMGAAFVTKCVMSTCKGGKGNTVLSVHLHKRKHLNSKPRQNTSVIKVSGCTRSKGLVGSKNFS